MSGESLELKKDALVGGRFRLIRLIGEGAMASVWSARHEEQGRDVAIKIIEASDDPERSARFLREAKVVSRFEHENIVGVVDAGVLEQSGRMFLAMELLRGSPLSTMLERGDALPATDVLPVLVEICRGLEVAHAAGVVHRDLKPENIFLALVPGKGVVPKIVDFGMSTSGDARARTKITAEGQILGTPVYMSPEQASARPDITPASDLWSIGVILYEAVTGELPFFGRTIGALLDSIVHAEPAPLPASVDARTRAVILRCLQKDPLHRHPDAASLREDMERALASLHGPDAATPGPPSSCIDPALVIIDAEPSRSRRSQRRALAPAKSPALVIAVVAALVGMSVLAVRRHPARAETAETGLRRLAKDRAALVLRSVRE